MKTEFPVTLSQSAKQASRAISRQRTVMLHSHPGLGKSSILKQLAKKHNLFVIDWRGSTADPTDLSGMPDTSGKYATYKPFDTFPLMNTAIPINPETKLPYNGWLLLMDEFNSAPRSVMAAAYKLILDREVGQHKLHPRVAIAAAGNFATSGAIVNPMGTAAQSRMSHLVIEADLTEFVEHGIKSGFDSRVLAFVGHRRKLLHNFTPDVVHLSFTCPRTWEMVSDYVKGEENVRQWLPLLAGTIGDGAAAEFVTFTELSIDLPKFDEIVMAPETTMVPDEAGHLYAMVGTISDALTPANVDEAMKYVNRMSKEYQYLIVRGASARDPNLQYKPSIDKWIEENAEFLFG